MIIGKIDAQLKGLTHYFTGAPCKHGHLVNRLVTTGACIECAKVKRKKCSPPTGFPKGRPRTGEIRPLSVNAIKMAEYRKNRQACDPTYKDAHNTRTSAWQAKNPERAREIARNSYKRRKERENGNE
ncbi:hypothetical protein [Acinetobacter sp.]|uniref:hypothetical protein n=1 Tax=Acinetobacter sp. TaxID=472 RepID=UPI00388E8204